MKVTLALAFIATISQGLLVIAAPSKSNASSGVPKMPKKVNFDNYYKAIMRANNLTAADVSPSKFGYGADKVEDQISTRAAGHSATKIFCVGVAWGPLRTHIFPDVHGCNRQGWTQSYAFTSYIQKNAVATSPWVACPSRDWGMGIIFNSRCPNGDAMASGYSNARDTHLDSYIYDSHQGQQFLDWNKRGDFNSDNRKYTYYGSMRHVGILHTPTQAEIDFMAGHVNSHPHLYKRISEYNTFTGTVGYAAQVLIDNLGDLTLRRNQGVRDIVPGAGFAADLRSFGLQHLAGRFLVRQQEAFQDSDRTYRHSISLYYQADNGQWQWMGGVTAPTDRVVRGGLVRSAFTEALRDHTTVRIDQAPTNNWMILPLPPTVALPSIPMMYSGLHGR